MFNLSNLFEHEPARGKLVIDQDLFWSDLIDYLKDEAIVPIIGPEVLTIEYQGRRGPYYGYLAWRLAEALEIPLDKEWAELSLNEAACQYLEQPRNRPLVLYKTLRRILNEPDLPLPEALIKLAEIRGINLFVTTTVDMFLEKALNRIRFNGEELTESLAYLAKPIDLPRPADDLTSPLVYHLYGHIASQQDFVLTDEDELEFMHLLQAEKRRPELLFDALRSRHLLLIGNHHSGWLARFFIRTVKNERLRDATSHEAIITGQAACQDDDLVTFLGSPLSLGTRMVCFGAAEDFIDELHRRWIESHGGVEPGAPSEPVTGQPLPPMPPGAVFISYASQDLVTVEKLKDHMEEFGLEVWFDKKRLEAGDEYDLKVRRNIRDCAVFVPVISCNTESRLEGYFRREWKYALDRALNIDDSVPFLMPVVIDDTEYNGLVPEEFNRRHWTRAKDGIPPVEFLKACQDQVRATRKGGR